MYSVFVVYLSASVIYDNNSHLFYASSLFCCLTYADYVSFIGKYGIKKNSIVRYSICEWCSISSRAPSIYHFSAFFSSAE